MKNILKEYLDLFGNSLLIIALMLSSFLLLINLYHYREVNYKYTYDINDSGQYQQFKSTIEKIEKNSSKTNTDIIKDQNKRMVLKSTGGQIDKCVALLKESDYYNLNTTTFDANNLYFLNNDIFTDIQNQCLFLLNYSIVNSLQKYSVDSTSYKSIDNYTIHQIDSIKKYSEFIKNELLQNSSYYYATDTTKDTIFNKLQYTTDLIMFNYNNLITNVNKIAEWYVTEAGGIYE